MPEFFRLLYGIVDTAYQRSAQPFFASIHPPESPPVPKHKKLGSSAGAFGFRWGLKGEEELGNGLSAVFNVEAGFDSTTGALLNGLTADAFCGYQKQISVIVVVGRGQHPAG